MSQLESIAIVYIYLAGLALSVAALLLVVLILRHPHRPRWLRSETVDQTAAFLFVVLFGFVLAATLENLIALDVSALVAVAICAATIAAASASIWLALRVGARLRQAEDGVSPFRRPRRRPSTRTGGDVPPQPTPLS